MQFLLAIINTKTSCTIGHYLQQAANDGDVLQKHDGLNLVSKVRVKKKSGCEGKYSNHCRSQLGLKAKQQCQAKTHFNNNCNGVSHFRQWCVHACNIANSSGRRSDLAYATQNKNQ